jgi:hypothetical protein
MWNKTWAGVGVKGGGMIGFFGLDTLESCVFRLDGLPNLSSHLVNVTNLRIGAGLGGSVGATAIFVFNAPTLLFAQDIPLLKDWGVNIALPETKVSGAKITFQAFKNCGNLKTILSLLKNFTPKDIENFRNIASFIYSCVNDYQEGASGSEPAVVAIDIPGIGSGAELSGFASFGKFEIDKAIQL